MNVQAFTDGVIVGEKLGAFVPFVSTAISALNLIFIKCVYEKSENSENPGFFDRYYDHLTKVDNGDYHYKLLIPFYNIYVAFKVYCCRKEVLINPPGLKLINEDNSLNLEARGKLEVENTLVLKDGSNPVTKGTVQGYLSVKHVTKQTKQSYNLWHQCLVKLPLQESFSASLTMRMDESDRPITREGSTIVVAPEEIFNKFHENLPTTFMQQIIAQRFQRPVLDAS